jgi:hypothetical protein
MYRWKKVCFAMMFCGLLFGASEFADAQQRLLLNVPNLTATMDQEYYTWYERGADATNPTAGLPHAGVVHALSDPSSTFLLQPYTGNNVLFLTGNTVIYRSFAVTTGTLTFVQPQSPRYLAFAATSADLNDDPINLTIHYADGTPDLNTSLGLIPDWTRGEGLLVASGSGKAADNLSTQFYLDNSATNLDVPRIFELPLAVATGLSPGLISSIDVSFASPPATTNGPNVAIFGVSGSNGSESGNPVYTPIALTPSSFNQDIVLEASSAPAVPEPGIAVFFVIGVGMIVGRRRWML